MYDAHGMTTHVLRKHDADPLMHDALGQPKVSSWRNISQEFFSRLDLLIPTLLKYLSYGPSQKSVQGNLSAVLVTHAERPRLPFSLTPLI